MEQAFMDYLISQGYKLYSPSGNKSTAYDYPIRINHILKWENLTWEDLRGRISDIKALYDVGGAKEKLGKKSHNAYICALRAFERFVNK